MKRPRSQADYRETADFLVEARAVKEVVTAELIKIGASHALAKRLSARARRRYRFLHK